MDQCCHLFSFLMAGSVPVPPLIFSSMCFPFDVARIETFTASCKTFQAVSLLRPAFPAEGEWQPAAGC
jgi:hypothetical protein